MSSLRWMVLVFITFVFSCTSPVSTEKINLDVNLYESVRYENNALIVDAKAIEDLLSNGANPNYIAQQGSELRSVLSHYVTRLSFHTSNSDSVDEQMAEILTMLFDAGAVIQSVDAKILFFPVAGGYYKTTKLLLEQGVSATNWPEDTGTGFTPIQYAEKEGRFSIVALLQNYGAKRTESDVVLQAKFIQAADNGDIPLMHELLLEGAKVNGKNVDNETALGTAIDNILHSENYCATISYLIDQGADVNVESESFSGTAPPIVSLTYYTSLILKSKRELPCLAKLYDLFLEKGAAVSAKDNRGRTPLHYSCEYNNLEMMKILLKNHANVMLRDAKGMTPLDYAESAEAIFLLKKFGAKEA